MGEAWKWVDSITEAWAMDNDAPKPASGELVLLPGGDITRDGRSLPVQ
ncbi:hypothetical protein ACLB1Q_02805 [Escherichia coli]